MFLNYQKSTGNNISETVKTNTFRTLIEMRSLNRNVRPPFQETPDQPLLSQEDIVIYDVNRAPKQYFAPGPTKPLGGPDQTSFQQLNITVLDALGVIIPK